MADAGEQTPNRLMSQVQYKVADVWELHLNYHMIPILLRKGMPVLKTRIYIDT